jgi:hypothetical protein
LNGNDLFCSIPTPVTLTSGKDQMACFSGCIVWFFWACPLKAYGKGLYFCRGG